MADIAFLLLIFFLVATTMNVDTGIQRVLPPMPDEKTKESIVDVKKRNILLVYVSKFDEVMVGGRRVELQDITPLTKEFITNPLGKSDLPEKVMTDINIIGNFPVSQGVVSLQNDRGTSYDMYIKVQNELTRAFTEYRNEVSRLKFGKKYDDLDDDARAAIQKAVPLKISEAEPRNIEGGK